VREKEGDRHPMQGRRNHKKRVEEGPENNFFRGGS